MTSVRWSPLSRQTGQYCWVSSPCCSQGKQFDSVYATYFQLFPRTIAANDLKPPLPSMSGKAGEEGEEEIPPTEGSNNIKSPQVKTISVELFVSKVTIIAQVYSDLMTVKW